MVLGQQDWKVGLGKERVSKINNMLSLFARGVIPSGERSRHKWYVRVKAEHGSWQPQGSEGNMGGRNE